MFVVLGASGHIGSALIRQLLTRGKDVLAATHDPNKIDGFIRQGAQAIAVDLHDVDALRAAFQRGQRAFLLNPPAPTSMDTDKEEHKTAHAIVAALRDTPLEKVVFASTYGAQPGERIGDLGILFDLEQALRQQPIPVSVLRSAYYMSNWDQMLAPASEGKLPTMFPADFCLSMVAPDDIAKVAAELLIDPPEPFAIHHIEGPQLYTPTDVAEAFSTALGRQVELTEVPRDHWEQTYLKSGFSPEAAQSYSRMTALTVDQGPETPSSPRRGQTTLPQYIRELVSRSSSHNK